MLASMRVALFATVLMCGPGAATSLIQTTSEPARILHFPSEYNDGVSRSEPPAMSWDDVWAQVDTLEPRSDKWFNTHEYQIMYKLMLQRWHGSAVGPKFLEIGLGCDMNYGPGASVKAWQTILPKMDLWEAEYDEACVNKSIADGTLPKDVSTLTGDQGNSKVVAQWAEHSGGNFDVVVDDGGHTNKMIKTSFDGLWPHVRKGGLYFLEDLQVGRRPHYDDTHGAAVISDIVQSWVDQLLVRDKIHRPERFPKPQHFPMPADVAWILCQSEACVIGKKM